MTTTTQKTVKLCWRTLAELNALLNELGMTRLISIQPTTPEYTNTAQWSSVHYECLL